MTKIKHWRTAGGATHKQKDEPVIVLPFKDVGASVPGIDITAGLMQEDDSPKSLQLGESTEEIGYVDPESLNSDEKVTVYTADLIEHTPIEERFRSFYERAVELSDGTVPANYKLEFIDSKRAPMAEEVLDSTEQYGEKTFGAVHEPPTGEGDKWSRELIEYL